MSCILLVEDDFPTSLSEKTNFETLGYRVITASSGEEAIAHCASNPLIDVVLMDIDLGPGIDGPEAAVAILAMREVPIIFLSSHREPEIVAKTEAITSYGYIIKSSGIAVIDASIKMALRLSEAKRKLWVEKEYLRTTLNSIGDAVIATDAAGKVTRMNPVAERLTGWDFARAEGLPIEEVFLIVNAQTRTSVKNPVSRVLESGAIMGLANHTVLRSRSGSEYQIADSAAPIFDSAGAASGVILVFRDVTADYGIHEALKRSEQLYRSLFTNMLNGLAYCKMHFDEEGHPQDFTYLSVNEAFEEQTGLRDVVGKRVTEVIPGIRESDDRLFELYGRVATSGAPERVEYFVESMQMWFQVSVYSPAREYFVAVFDVITKRKTAEAALEENEERLRLALRAAKAGTWEWDMGTNANTWSDELWPLYGLSRDNVVPSYEAWLSSILPEDRERIVGELRDTIRAGTELNIEWRVASDSTEPRWLMTRGRPKVNTAGQVVRYLGVVIEISDRKRAEETVRGLLAEKELLLKEVHHRVKNNMNTIHSFLYLQAEATHEPYAKRALKDAGGRVQSMLVLYDKLYQSGEFEKMPVRLYLSPLIDQIVENFANHDSVKIEKKIEDFVLDAKRLQPLGIILNELLTNVMKYAFEGRERGRIQVAAMLADKKVIFVVADDGIGLPEGVRFDHSGGFGLLLIDGLSRQLDGVIRAESRSGTRIVLEFPL
jgi:PAS domain S-box-containing protein